MLKQDRTKARPHLISFVACTRKAEIHAAATVINRMAPLSGELCACKTKPCKTAVGARLKAARTTLGGELDKLAAQLPNAERERLEHITNEVDRCSGGAPEPKKMDQFAAQMCRCKDPACAKRVQKTMSAWVIKHFKGGKKKGTKANVERWKRAQKKYGDCFVRLMRRAKP